MSVVDTDLVFYRFDDICEIYGSDDVSTVQALAEEVGVEAVINARNEYNSCLHIAVERGKVKIVRQLIAWRANLNIRDLFGRTPLFLAKSGEMARVLVQGGAKVNVTNKYGKSCLSVITRNPEVVEALLDKGALVKYGRFSPLVRAVEWHRVEAIRVLLAHRGFVRVINWKDSVCSETAREVAVRYGRHDIVGMLDGALVLAKAWDRRLPFARVGLAAADGRYRRWDAKNNSKDAFELQEGTERSGADVELAEWRQKCWRDYKCVTLPIRPISHI